MVNPELSKFVQDQRALGSSDEQIKQALLAKGWAEGDINMALSGVVNAEPVNSTGQLMSITNTIKQTWEIFTNNASQYLSVMLIMTVLTALFSWYSAEQQQGVKQGEAGLVAQYPILIVLMLAVIVVGVLTQIMILYMALRRNEKLSTSALLSMATPKFLGSFWVSFLTGVVVLVGFLLLIVPGVYLAVATMFGSLVYLDQNIKGYDAITKSREYVKGRWSDVFARMVVAGLIYILATIIVTVPFGDSPMVANIASSALSLILTPLGAIYMVLIYEQLKSTKSA